MADRLPEEWTPKQQQLYLRVLRFFSRNQANVKHPRAPLLEAEHWDTISHNAAYMAAELLENEDFEVRNERTDEVLTTPRKLDS